MTLPCGYNHSLSLYLVANLWDSRFCFVWINCIFTSHWWYIGNIGGTNWYFFTI